MCCRSKDCTWTAIAEPEGLNRALMALSPCLCLQLLRERLEVRQPSMEQSTRDLQAHVSMLSMKQQQYTQQKEAAQEELQMAGFRPEVMQPCQRVCVPPHTEATPSCLKNVEAIRAVASQCGEACIDAYQHQPSKAVLQATNLMVARGLHLQQAWSTCCWTAAEAFLRPLFGNLKHAYQELTWTCCAAAARRITAPARISS